MLPKLDHGSLMEHPSPGVHLYPREHPNPREHLHKCYLLSTLLVCKMEKLWLFGLQEVGIRTICLVWCLFN